MALLVKIAEEFFPFTCTNADCGEILQLTGTLNATKPKPIRCPKCGSEYYFFNFFQVLDVVGIKSNAPLLLHTAGMERELEAIYAQLEVDTAECMADESGDGQQADGDGNGQPEGKQQETATAAGQK